MFIFQQERGAEGQTSAEEMNETKKRGEGIEGGSSLFNPHLFGHMT